MSEKAIHISLLSYKYPNTDIPALKNLDLHVPMGSCTLILGSNGAGKSTLMSLICGLIQKQEGSLVIAQAWPHDFFSYGTQNCALYADLSVEENLELFAKLMNNPTAALAKIKNVADKMDLGSYLKKKIAHCSGGIRQRTHVASTLLGSYPLLVLDEPFNNIDPESRVLISAALKDYMTDNKATVLLSSHQFEAMEELWTHLAFLKNGSLSDFIDKKQASTQKLQSLFFELKNAEGSIS